MNQGAMPAYPIMRQEFIDNSGDRPRPVVILEQFGLTKREAITMVIMPELVAHNEKNGSEFGFDSPAQVSKRAAEQWGKQNQEQAA